MPEMVFGRGPLTAEVLRELSRHPVLQARLRRLEDVDVFRGRREVPVAEKLLDQINTASSSQPRAKSNFLGANDICVSPL